MKQKPATRRPIRAPHVMKEFFDNGLRYYQIKGKRKLYCADQYDKTFGCPRYVGKAPGFSLRDFMKLVVYYISHPQLT